MDIVFYIFTGDLTNMIIDTVIRINQDTRHYEVNRHYILKTRRALIYNWLDTIYLMLDIIKKASIVHSCCIQLSGVMVNIRYP